MEDSSTSSSGTTTTRSSTSAESESEASKLSIDDGSEQLSETSLIEDDNRTHKSRLSVSHRRPSRVSSVGGRSRISRITVGTRSRISRRPSRVSTIGARSRISERQTIRSKSSDYGGSRISEHHRSQMIRSKSSDYGGNRILEHDRRSQPGSSDYDGSSISGSSYISDSDEDWDM